VRLMGRTFNAPDCDGAPQLIVQRQRGRRPELGILASLVNTAKLHELDPQAYLADVLERIVSRRPRAISCTSSWPGTGRRLARGARAAT
jgi:hypothetical protein